MTFHLSSCSAHALYMRSAVSRWRCWIREVYFIHDLHSVSSLFAWLISFTRRLSRLHQVETCHVFRPSLETRCLLRTAKALWSKLWTPVLRELWRELWTPVLRELWRELWTSVLKELWRELWAPVLKELWRELWTSVLRELWTPLNIKFMTKQSFRLPHAWLMHHDHVFLTTSSYFDQFDFIQPFVRMRRNTGSIPISREYCVKNLFCSVSVRLLVFWYPADGSRAIPGHFFVPEVKFIRLFHGRCNNEISVSFSVELRTEGTILKCWVADTC